MVELQLDGISKTFARGNAVLDDLSLTVKPGEYLTLVGPSGCGKTTLLRVIAGLEDATTGELRMDGKRVNETPSHRRAVAMLFQQPALIPQYTVEQSLRAAWRWTLFKDAEREAELSRIASMLGLQADLRHPVGQLSGGQQQRVALARCLLRRPKLCLFDEPLGHLDAPLRSQLRRQIRDIADELRFAAIHVTHDPDEAFAVGDRVAVMSAGRIVQVDTVKGLHRMPRNRFVAEMIHHSSGGLNTLAGHIRQDGLDTTFESPFGRWPMPAQSVSDLRESLQSSKILHGSDKSPPKDVKVAIMIGIAAHEVRCSTEPARSDDIVSLRLPVRSEEADLHGTWIIAGDERGRWIGRLGVQERVERGQVVLMTFSMSRAYWFDAVTGRTLVAPTG